MRPVAIFRFSPTETPGRFGEWLTAQSIPWTLIALDEGVAVPSSPAAYGGIGMMGGPMSVNDGLPWVAPLCSLLRDAISDGTPVIGHCLGGQLMAKALGARVARMPKPEIGWLHVDVCDRGARREWFGGLPRFSTFQWHYDAFDLPPMATRVLTNDFAVEPGFRDRRPAHRVPVPRRDDARTGRERGAGPARGELPARSSAHQQSAADLQSDLDARLAALGAVADGVYARWAEGLKR